MDSGGQHLVAYIGDGIDWNVHIYMGEALNLGNWYYVAMTYSTVDKIIKIYLNGKEVLSETETASLINSITPLGIGALKYHGSWDNFFNGIIDDVRIYNVALSAEEVEELYREGLSNKAFNPKPADGEGGIDPNVVLIWSPGKDAVSHDVYLGRDFNEVNEADIYDANVYMGNQDANYWDANNYDSNGLEPDTTFYWRIDELSTAGTTKGDVWSFQTLVEPNLVSWWRFDEDTGTIAYDSAGDNDGQLIGGPVWTTGHIEGGLSFDGVNDYVDVQDDPSLRFSQYSSFTFALWVNPMSYSYNVIFCKMRTGGQHNIFGYYMRQNGDTNAFDFVTERSGHSYVLISTPNNSITSGNWYHVVCVYDNTNMKIYLNGQLKDTYTFTGGTGTSTPDKNMAIGARSFDSTIDGFFTGTLDDIRVYNRALTDEEILQLYQGGL
jgi:hypothetical protein